MTEDNELIDMCRDAANAVDTTLVWKLAREAFMNDATMPLDMHEHVCRIAGALAAQRALTAYRNHEVEL